MIESEKILSDDKKRSLRIFILFLVSMCATLAVQLIYWHRVDPTMTADVPRYLFIARSLLDLDFKHALHFHYQPLFPAFISMFIPFFQTGESASRAACIAAAMLTVIPVYFIAQKVFNRNVALIILLIWPFKFFRSPLTSDAQTFFNLLLYAGIYTGLLAIMSRRFKHVVITAFIFGLASLAKIEAQAFAFLWFGILILSLVFRGFSGRKSLALFLAGMACYIAIISPYLLAYYRATGRFSLNPKSAPLVFGHNEPDWNHAWYSLREDEQGKYTLFQRVIAEGDRQPLEMSSAGYIYSNRSRLFPIYFDRLLFTFKSIIPAYLWFLMPGSGLLGGLLILAGLIRPGWTRDDMWKELYLACFAFAAILSVPMFLPNMRFFSPLTPVIMLFAARGIEQISLRIQGVTRFFSRKLYVSVPEAVIIVFIAAACIAPDILFLYRLPRETEYTYFREDREIPAEWIRENLSPGRKIKIMSNWREIPFWHLLGTYPEDDICLPLAGLDDVLSYAQQENVEYIILESGHMPKRYPELAPLLTPKFFHPALERVYYRRSPHGHLYAIYRIKS